jgi:hypothetical protein
VLREVGLANAWARVERVEGTAPFFAYGVVNDEATGDGSFVRAIPAGRTTRGLTIPAVVESERYESDLVLTNSSPDVRHVWLTYLADAMAGFSPADAVAPSSTTFELVVPARGQLYLRGVVEELRRRGIPGIVPKGPAFVGALFAEATARGPQYGLPGFGDPVPDLFIGVRTRTVGGFGIFYEGVPTERLGRTEPSTIPGVRQDTSARTNIGIVNLGFRGDFTVRALDPATGNVVAERTVTVNRLGWAQVDSILAGTGVEAGCVRVIPPPGDAPFLAYGITNDGAAPGFGTGDGAFLEAR